MSVDKDITSKDMLDGFEIAMIFLLTILFVFLATTIALVLIISGRVRNLRRDINHIFKETRNLEMIRYSDDGYHVLVKTSIRTALMELIVREQKRSDSIQVLVPQDERAPFSKAEEEEEVVTYQDKFVTTV